MVDMTGQVALVTGGARGIGRAISQRLAERGVRVAVGDYSDPEASAELAEKYDWVTVHQGNIARRADCERVVEEVCEQHGHIDILVNNAGITLDKMIHKMEVEDWEKVVQVNLTGTFYMSHLVFQRMRERQNGRIISISSVVGERGNAGQANYAATKSGLFGLTMSLALEGAKKGITANCVAPGYIETDMVASVPQAALDKVIAQVPIGRLGQPDEIARAVEFLADPDSAYITGQILSVNGGLYM